MTNITAIEVSIEALEKECQHTTLNSWKTLGASVIGNEYDRRAKIFTLLERLGHSSKAIEVYNTYAPDFAKRPLSSSYY